MFRFIAALCAATLTFSTLCPIATAQSSTVVSGRDLLTIGWDGRTNQSGVGKCLGVLRERQDKGDCPAKAVRGSADMVLGTMEVGDRVRLVVSSGKRMEGEVGVLHESRVTLAGWWRPTYVDVGEIEEVWKLESTDRAATIAFGVLGGVVFGYSGARIICYLSDDCSKKGDITKVVVGTLFCAIAGFAVGGVFGRLMSGSGEKWRQVYPS